MKKIIRTNREGLNRILEQAVKNKISERIRKASLNEWGDEEEDDYTSDLLNSDLFNFSPDDLKSTGAASKAAEKDGETEFSDEEEPDGFGDDVDLGEPEDETEPTSDEIGEPEEETPVVDNVKDWGDRGDEMEIDGIPITQENGKFSIVAKDSNPQVQITGSNLDAVKSIYNAMWNRGFSEVVPFAYSHGTMNYLGILLTKNQAESYNIDTTDLPIVIDTDIRK